MAPVEPAAIGKYEVRGTLGRGAMGVVYDGWHPELDRRVAIKTVDLPAPDDEEAIEIHARFKREAQSAARLAHPNIVGVYDYGETGQSAYIVMEFVAGETLRTVLEREKFLSPPRAVRITQDILNGLQFSHEHGIVHRDIKPANIIMTKDGRVKIADFGVARVESSSMTRAGAMIGTPAYMSPEQFRGDAVDARSDLYSVGVLLYQLLTGDRPFRGDLATIMQNVLNTMPPAPSSVRETVPASLDAVVARAIARQPADRYPNAGSFAHALQQAIDLPFVAGAATPAARETDETSTIFAAMQFGRSATVDTVQQDVTVLRPAPPQSRRGLLAGGAVAAVLILAAGAWLLLRPATPPRPAPVASIPAASTPPAASETVASSPASPAPSAASPPLPGADAGAAAASSAPSTDPTASIAPPPAEPPIQTALAPPDPAAIRAALSRVAGAARCALPVVAVSDDGHASVYGFVGAGQPESELRSALRAVVPDADWSLRSVTGPYCGALDLLRTINQTAGSHLGLTLKGDVDHLKDGDPIVPVLKLPDFPAHLHVDYLSSDGTVGHLFPADKLPDKVFPAGASIRLGGADTGVGAVSAPFGTDLIIAVASSAPVLAAHRTDGESISGYLAELQAAINAARDRGTLLVGSAAVVQTTRR